MVVSRAAVDDVSAFFSSALKLGFPIEKVIPANAYGFDDEAMMADNNSSGFNYRAIAGSSVTSLHASGLAFDVNPRLNPYIRYPSRNSAIVRPPGATRDVEIPGTLHVDHPLVSLMRAVGWEWGGDWKPESGRTDYQHFQRRLQGI